MGAATLVPSVRVKMRAPGRPTVLVQCHPLLAPHTGQVRADDVCVSMSGVEASSEVDGGGGGGDGNCDGGGGGEDTDVVAYDTKAGAARQLAQDVEAADVRKAVAPWAKVLYDAYRHFSCMQDADCFLRFCTALGLLDGGTGAGTGSSAKKRLEAVFWQRQHKGKLGREAFLGAALPSLAGAIGMDLATLLRLHAPRLDLVAMDANLFRLEAYRHLRLRASLRSQAQGIFTGPLDLSGFQRACGELLLIDVGVQFSSLERAFALAKPVHEARLSAPQFLEALARVAAGANHLLTAPREPAFKDYFQFLRDVSPPMVRAVLPDWQPSLLEKMEGLLSLLFEARHRQAFAQRMATPGARSMTVKKKKRLQLVKMQSERFEERRTDHLGAVLATLGPAYSGDLASLVIVQEALQTVLEMHASSQLSLEQPGQALRALHETSDVPHEVLDAIVASLRSAADQ